MKFGRTNPVLNVLCCLFVFVVLLGCSKCSKCFRGEKGIKPLQIIDVKIGVGDTQTDKFALSDKIKVSYDLKDLFAINIGGKPNVWIRQDIMVCDATGSIVLLRPGILEIKKPLSDKPARFINEISLSAIENLKAGNYKIYLLVTDLVSFQIKLQEIPFVIK
ncbi:MAG: hypothetical protein V1833_04665 [Elusimicrobiota bacterium]